MYFFCGYLRTVTSSDFAFSQNCIEMFFVIIFIIIISNNKITLQSRKIINLKFIFDYVEEYAYPIQKSFPNSNL
jgi:hypothetical protein